MNGKSNKTLAREAALQGIYQWQVAGDCADEIDRQFRDERGLGLANKKLFGDLLRGVISEVETLDAAMKDYLDRPMADVDPVERAILRLGAYEMIFHTDTPFRVILNETINLAKTFGSADSHKFVNSILDKVAKHHRQGEAVARVGS